jgi:hypothetical protein
METNDLGEGFAAAEPSDQQQRGVETSGLEPLTSCLQSRPTGIQGSLSESQPAYGSAFGTGWTALDDGSRAINAR